MLLKALTYLAILLPIILLASPLQVLSSPSLLLRRSIIVGDESWNSSLLMSSQRLPYNIASSDQSVSSCINRCGGIRSAAVATVDMDCYCDEHCLRTGNATFHSFSHAPHIIIHHRPQLAPILTISRN
jgi:hypothetical protein